MAEPGACVRAREWASRRLDRELSEFEHVLLEAHLARCEACCVFDAGVRASTQALRAAPLLPIRWPVSLPHRRSRNRPLLTLSAAAIGALLVALSIVNALPSSKPSSRVRALAITAHAAREEPYPRPVPCPLELSSAVARHVVNQYCG